MGFINPVSIAQGEHENSLQATEILTAAIVNQQRELPRNLEESSKAAKSEIRARRRDQQMQLLNDLKTRMSPSQKRANEIACETGSSNWMTTLPIEEKGFVLTKREFWDAVAIRYSWPLQRMPSMCACGSRFDLSHALSCKKGSFVSQRHNELRDLTANLLAEVCQDVRVEPPLNELTGEVLELRTANKSSEARLDISARGVWANGQRAFFDVRVFDPLARKYNGQTLQQCYRMNEQGKKRTLTSAFYK